MKKFRSFIVSVLRLPVFRHVSSVILGAYVTLVTALHKNCHARMQFTVMQVGARGGADPYTRWLRYWSKIHTIGVEPESTGLQKLQEEKAYDDVVSHALSDNNGSSTLYVTKARGWCSLLRPDETAIKRVVTPRCWDARPFEVVKTETINVITLDSIKQNLPTINYLQIDVQGAELSVVQGAENTLKDIAVIELEVRFYPLYQEEKTFKDINAYLETQDFFLFQMIRQGETEFGDRFVEANACYFNANIARKQPDLMETLEHYAKAKHALYGNSVLRLFCDICSTKHLTTHVIPRA